MTRRLWSAHALGAGLVVFAALTIQPACAGRWEIRQEVREGIREVEREKREARREIRRCETRECVKREVREGYREVQREKREARREVRGALRDYRDERYGDKRGKDLLKGLIIGAAAVGVATAIANSSREAYD